MMTLVNDANKEEKRYREVLEGLVLLLAPFAPHLGEELWERLGHPASVVHARWPSYDEALCVEDLVKVIVQVNGKVRDRIRVPVQATKEDIEAAARIIEGSAKAMGLKVVEA